jgi:nitrate/TMAO reductase-like tetraheme cytochrome c subunit
MADASRNTSNTRIYPTANNEMNVSGLFQLRGGTSGVHARNFSDFEPQKHKNRSFFNKYKESKNNQNISATAESINNSSSAAH